MSLSLCCLSIGLSLFAATALTRNPAGLCSQALPQATDLPPYATVPGRRSHSLPEKADDEPPSSPKQPSAQAPWEVCTMAVLE